MAAGKGMITPRLSMRDDEDGGMGKEGVWMIDIAITHAATIGDGMLKWGRRGYGWLTLLSHKQ